MPIEIVLTLTGPDRVGIVESLTEALLKLGGNVQTSRMARLGGEFAILMLLSMPEEKVSGLDQALQSLTSWGYKVTATRTDQSQVELRSNWRAFEIRVQGADHEGIVHQIARSLSHSGINIEAMETGTIPAPMSGTPLFFMKAMVTVPPEVADKEWRHHLNDAAQISGVDISIEAAAMDEQQ